MNKPIFILTIIFLITFASASFLFYQSSKIMEKKELVMKLVVTNNPNEVMPGNSTDFIDFGVVLAGSNPKAHLTFANNNEKMSLITIKKSGELSKFVNITQNEFLLEPNQTKWVLLEASMPEMTVPREYYGKVSIIQKRI